MMRLLTLKTEGDENVVDVADVTESSSENVRHELTVTEDKSENEKHEPSKQPIDESPSPVEVNRKQVDDDAEKRVSSKEKVDQNASNPEMPTKKKGRLLNFRTFASTSALEMQPIKERRKPVDMSTSRSNEKSPERRVDESSEEKLPVKEKQKSVEKVRNSCALISESSPSEHQANESVANRIEKLLVKEKRKTIDKICNDHTVTSRSNRKSSDHRAEESISNRGKKLSVKAKRRHSVDGSTSKTSEKKRNQVAERSSKVEMSVAKEKSNGTDQRMGRSSKTKPTAAQSSASASKIKLSSDRVEPKESNRKIDKSFSKTETKTNTLPSRGRPKSSIRRVDKKNSPKRETSCNTSLPLRKRKHADQLISENESNELPIKRKRNFPGGDSSKTEITIPDHELNGCANNTSSGAEGESNITVKKISRTARKSIRSKAICESLPLEPEKVDSPEAIEEYSELQISMDDAYELIEEEIVPAYTSDDEFVEMEVEVLNDSD